MITLLHGDNIVASRAKLDELKSEARGKEIRSLEGKTVSDADILQALESQSLFGGETLVIVENYFSLLGKKMKEAGRRADLLKQSGEGDIIIWESKEVSKTVITSLGTSAKNILFKLPVVIFDFLDSVRPDNVRQMSSLYRDAIALDAPELIHALLVRRVRQLLMVRDGVIPHDMQSWQAKRLTNQARLFTIEQLLSMYQRLLESELSIRTGSSPFTLAECIEQVLIKI